MSKNHSVADIWIFVFSALTLSCLLCWFYTVTHVALLLSAAPFIVGILGFIFQRSVNHTPLIELYSKGHPYRKLKPYGILTAFVFFEFLLAWGLHTKQILTTGDESFLMAVVFLGVIVYYHSFVRMKISLRFLFLGVFVPLIASGTALGLGSYFKILKFIVPHQQIGVIILLNSIYWVLFHIFMQIVCMEPAFRGYLMQRLLYKGETFAILLSSLVFTFWYVPFFILSKMSYAYILLMLCGNFIMGVIFALLFIKGRNLLVAVLCHGIINGLRNSFFASGAHPGIRANFEFIVPQGETELLALWFGCLFVGLVLITIIPRKKLNVR